MKRFTNKLNIVLMRHWGQGHEALGSGLVSCIVSDCYVIKQHVKTVKDRI